MSSGNDNQFNSGSPVGATTTKSGGGKKFMLFGGIGCFTLLLLCGGGGFFFFQSFVKPMMEFVEESVTIAETSQIASDNLGTPVFVDRSGMTQVPRQSEGMMDFKFPISGPDGSGVLIVEAKMNGLTPERQTMSIQMDGGETISLDEDANFELNIDDGTLE